MPNFHKHIAILAYVTNLVDKEMRVRPNLYVKLDLKVVVTKHLEPMNELTIGPGAQ